MYSETTLFSANAGVVEGTLSDSINNYDYLKVYGFGADSLNRKWYREVPLSHTKVCNGWAWGERGTTQGLIHKYSNYGFAGNTFALSHGGWYTASTAASKAPGGGFDGTAPIFHIIGVKTGDTKATPYNETVLFEGGDSSACTFSERADNFERVKFYGHFGDWQDISETMVHCPGLPGVTLTYSYRNNSTATTIELVHHCKVYINSANYMNCTLLEIGGYCYAGNTNTARAYLSNARMYFNKVVGINRTANN